MYDIYTTDTLKLFVQLLTKSENGVDYPRYYDIIHNNGTATTDEDVEQMAEEIENNILTKLKGM